jgi:hypothetical protein
MSAVESLVVVLAGKTVVRTFVEQFRQFRIEQSQRPLLLRDNFFLVFLGRDFPVLILSTTRRWSGNDNSLRGLKTPSS